MLKKALEREPIRFIREIVEIYFQKRVSRSAAELAYFLILTFFPVMICVNSFIGLLDLNPGTILDAAAGLMPEGGLEVLADYLGYITLNQSRAMLVGGLIATLFASSAAFRSLMNIMNDIYGRQSYQGFRKLVASGLCSVMLLITIYLSIVVVLTGEWFFRIIDGWFRLHDLAIPWAWQWLRFLVQFCLVLVFVLLAYRMSAPLGRPRPPILTGGVLASGALVGASILFSWFIGMSSKYSLLYGSLASVIILLVWLYLCGNILILGNVFNFVWYTRKRKRYLQHLGQEEPS